MILSRIAIVCLASSLFAAAVQRPLCALAEEPAAKIWNAGLHHSEITLNPPGGVKVTRNFFLWYPTEAMPEKHDYKSQIGHVAVNAALPAQKFPLLIFSHGLLGAGDQCIFVTEELARQGYIVAAVDHADSLRSGTTRKRRQEPGFTEFKSWTDKTYLDRKQDLTALVDAMLAMDDDPKSHLHKRVDRDKIGAIGHSLGGYSVLGLCGGWPAWKDDRIKAAVLFSPFTLPYSDHGKLDEVKVPVMLQGGTLDFGITPFLGASYDKLQVPKYYLVLEGETHFAWTNLLSLGKTTQQAIESGNAELIIKYTDGFLDRHLQSRDMDGLDGQEPRLDSYLHASP